MPSAVFKASIQHLRQLTGNKPARHSACEAEKRPDCLSRKRCRQERRSAATRSDMQSTPGESNYVKWCTSSKSRTIYIFKPCPFLINSQKTRRFCPGPRRWSWTGPFGPAVNRRPKRPRCAKRWKSWHRPLRKPGTGTERARKRSDWLSLPMREESVVTFSRVFL